MTTQLNRRELLGGLAALTAAGTSWSQDSADQTGPRNLITDVAGRKVGSAEDADIATGTTVILPDAPAVAAGDVRGGGPATRETDLLRAENLVQEVDGIVLSGG